MFAPTARVALALALAAGTPACTHQRGNAVDDSPTVQATLGDSFAAVAQASTVDLGARERAPDVQDLVTVTKPSSLSYGRGPKAVRLAAGRYLALTVDAGHVTGITASPHLQPLTLDQAVAEAARVAEQLRGTAWGAVAAVSADSLRAAALADDSGFFEHDFGRWTAGGDRLVVRVRQVGDAGAAGRDPGVPAGVAARRYLLSVEFENPDVDRRFGDMAVEALERRQAQRAPR